MPKYVFTVDTAALPGVAEEFPDDASAKRHGCTIVDEINRNAKTRSLVLVLDDEGEVVAAVRPVE